MATITIKEVTDYLETIAPRSLQEDYDNSGLLTGNAAEPVKGVLVTLDCTEAVVEEAIQTGCNLVVAHHPIVFRGLKKLTGQNYIERTIIKAIKNDIAIYAIHTNLDNVYAGVNRKICQKLGLVNTRILAPKADTLLKLITFIPSAEKDNVLQALYEAGAGQIGNYKDCSFQLTGEGTFTPNKKATPYLGRTGIPERVEEIRAEVILPKHNKGKVLAALRKSHPYEEVAYYLSTLENENQEVGSGMIGELPEAMEPMAFLKRLKYEMKTDCIRHTAITTSSVKRVAVCGGAGSFLLSQARSQSADIFISADFKYHEFFDADGKIIIADIGHYESEQFTKDLLHEVLREKFATFAINFSKSVTNPISYF